MRIDRDVLEFFKQGGRGYQTRINAILRAYKAAQTREEVPVRAGKVIERLSTVPMNR